MKTLSEYEYEQEEEEEESNDNNELLDSKWKLNYESEKIFG